MAVSKQRRNRGLLASAVGLVLLLVGGYEAAGLRARLSPSSLLIGASNVVQTSDGSLFVGSDLARVHVYSSEGRPLRGFQVPVERFVLRRAADDTLLVVPRDGSPSLRFSTSGESLEPPLPEALPDDPMHRIVRGDVRRGDRVLVRGYRSHSAMLLHALVVGGALFAGGFLLIGGVLYTGRRAP